MKYLTIGLLIVTFITISLANGASTNPRIIVIGAGAAGIATASRLYQRGLKNVTLLEASNRIGGRINTIPFAGGVVELGAQWCHGEVDNIVYEMVKEYPDLLKSSIVADDAALVLSDGERVPDSIVQKLSILAEEIVESEARQSYAGSLGEYFTETYWRRLQFDAVNYSDVSRELAEQFLVYYHNYERGYTAYDSWFEVAANETDSYQESEGNPVLAWNSTKGYSIILDIVSGNYPGATNNSIRTPVPLEQLIEFNKFVTNIEWDGTSDRQHVHVHTEDGSVYETDHVVVTVPLGVLKENHRSLFTPTLPAVNQRAISGIYFGTVNKIYLLFDKPIPQEVPNTISLLWYESDLQAIRNSVHEWTEAVSTFFRVDHHPNVLAAWLNGVEGRQAERMLDADIREGLLHLLSIFAKNTTFGNVVDVSRSKWSTNPLFRAAGIAAASRLYQKGFKNITILEASQRFGGRIRTTPFGGGIVELGAQWCHGEQGNVVYQLASVYPGLLKSSIIADEDAVLIRSSGV
uniref:Amine oxidase domain-containing protein n=1 Tax=Anopheles maculatus TaxID=74869 RepID=A0A182S6F0_9DIPT